MNIVNFTDTYYPLVNGVSVAVEQLAEKSSEDNNVIVFAPSYSLRASIEKKDSLTLYKIRSVPFPIYPGVHAAIPNLFKMYKILKEIKPDIIHFHTPFVLGILGTIFSQILGIKLVGTFHTLFTQQIMNMTPKRLLLGKQVPADTSEKGLFPLILWKLQIIFFNLCDLVVAPTKGIAGMLKRQGIKTKIALLPSGLDIRKFPVKTDFTLTLKIIHLGRLGFEKSTEVIFDAFSIVLEKLPTARLVIAGDGPAKWGLKRYARKLKIANSVDFLGMINPKNTPEVYRSGDIFATASTFETQGLVLIEAMLSGLPIVAAAVNAPKDLIQHKKTGYLFEEGNSKQCANYMIELLTHPEKNEHMGKLARKYAESFDIGLTSQQLIVNYRKIIANRL